MAVKVAPLPHEWMLVSIIGFLISYFFLFRGLSGTYAGAKAWGFTFMLFFLLVFIASVTSMSNAGTTEEELVELAIHDKRVRAAQHRKSK